MQATTQAVIIIVEQVLSSRNALTSKLFLTLPIQNDGQNQKTPLAQTIILIWIYLLMKKPTLKAITMLNQAG